MRLDHAHWHDHGQVERDLVFSYAMDFWAGTWEELLAVRDSNAHIVEQFGTFDKNGKIFPNTATLLAQAGIAETDIDWPRKIYTLAGEGMLVTPDGRTISQFWSLEAAHAELNKFLSPTEQGGFEGELLVLITEDNIIAGFSALSCLQGERGRKAVHHRYPVTELYIPHENEHATLISLEGILQDIYPQDDIKFGIFLDHAISEKLRGHGLGSLLFDKRIERLVELEADVIIGRTLIDAVAQYKGNYLARGLKPFAADGTDRKKHYFSVRTTDLKARKTK